MPSVRKGSGRWQQARLIGSPRGETWSRREVPEHILAADLMTLFGRIATGMSFPFGWCAVSLLTLNGFPPCNLRRGGRAPEPPLFPARRYAVSGTGKCRNSDAAHRAPYAASLRRQRLPKWNLRNRPCYIRNPSLLFPAIRKNARCSLSRENSP
jgi:hypothetical protein